jgi:anti-sigma factor RsiW
MLQHSEYTMLMSLVLDGEACEDEEARLSEHLRSCDECAKTWQRWRELDRRLAFAPAVPAPVDFAALVVAQLDTRMAQERHRRLLLVWMAVATLATVAVAVLSLAILNGWPLQFVAAQGPLAAAWAGLSSTGGWVLRVIAEVFERVGAPTIAAATGAMICLTCLLAMTWLWVVSRIGLAPQARLTAD